MKRLLPLLLVGLSLLVCVGCSVHVPPERPVTDQLVPQATIDWQQAFAQPRQIEIVPLLTGEIQVERSILLDLDSPHLDDHEDRSTWVPVLAYLIRHPTQGTVLIDSGFDASFAESGHGNFGGLAQFVSFARQKPGWDTASLLRSIGVEPRTLSMIIVSHFHAAHTAGLPGLDPGVPLYDGPGATAGYEPLWYAPYDHLAGIPAVQTFDFRTPETSENAEGAGHTDNIDLGPAIDVFGDSSFFVILTPGHAAGNLSFIVNGMHGPVLLTCDASHTREGFERQVGPGKVSERARADATLQRLQRFVARFPQLRVKFGHEPTDWDLSRGVQESL